MQLFLKFLLQPLKMEYLMKFNGMKRIVIIFCVFGLLIATAESIAVGLQQPTLNYKQQLQYQMQQHDKYEYQQHIKQQQQYYQQQYKQQQQQLTPTAQALMQQQEQQQQQRYQHQSPSASSSYLAAKPTQILQTAASLIVDDSNHHQLEALALGQPEYSNANSQRRRPANRKRKRRPQPINLDDDSDGPVASNAPPYWMGQVEDDKKALNMPAKQIVKQVANTEDAMRPSLQASFKRRKQPTIREPLAALEKEQKLYEMRNKPDSSNGPTAPINNRNSADLKNILKNSGGLSLSEILQQKNLSLDDLLKGKQNALQALQTTAMAPLEKSGHNIYNSFKPNFKATAPAVKLSEGATGIEDRSKLTALHRLKLFGSSSRPSVIQVGLADHLTTRKREGNLHSSTTTTITSTTSPKPSTTKIPLYKKILHQRPTLKPTFLLKNMGTVATAEPEKVVTSWDSKEQQQEIDNANSKAQENKEEEEHEEEEEMETEEEIPETTTSKTDTTITPTTTLSPTTTTSTFKKSTERTSYRDLSSTTRRMYTSTRGHGRTTYRYISSTSTTPPPPPTTTTTTTEPMTTTTTTSTTTASSSTMNLTPKANLNLNTEDIRERIQETLLKNLIEKEDSFKKSQIKDGGNDDDLENFFEETVKPKTAKAYESSTITTRMKQFSPLFSTSSSISTTSDTAQKLTTASSSTSKENLNIIPDFDNVDDRTDLLELIEDRRSGNRLFKVLEQRNMTLEELIEHRKRGSSQLHLATIVQNPSRFYPDKKVVLQDNMDIVTAFENFPHFNLLNLKSVKPDDIKTDSQGSSYFTSIIDIEPTDEVYKNRKGTSALTAAELDKASLLADRSEKSLGFFPSWKSLALASLATSASTTNNNNNNNNNNINRNIPFYVQQQKMLLENNSENEQNNDIEDVYDIKDNELMLISHDENEDDDNDNDYQNQNPVQAAVRLPDSDAETIETEVSRAHDLVELELSGHGFKRSPQAAGALAHSHRHGTFYTNMPAGIKSAIVASATIVLTALVTFMVIFAICRWKQRRHRMTNIMKTYNAMKSKMPAIATTAATMPASITGLAALTRDSAMNSNSRRSSFRDIHDLLGGSGLSVAATITTTSTGVPNSPLTTTKTLANSLTTPPLNASQASTTTTATTGLVSGNNYNRNMQQQQQHIYNQNPNNNSCNSNSNKISYNSRPLQRQSSLLFQRNTNNSMSNSNSNSSNDKPTNLAILSGCNLLDMKRNKMNGSTTSLSFSLTSGHNISNAHINTMDANSPEVQEYLFDTLRKSF